MMISLKTNLLLVITFSSEKLINDTLKHVVEVYA